MSILCIRLPRDERGLTLLEVLLSTVVLGVALTGFLMAISTASTSTRVASDENQLVYLASLEFEALRATDFEKIPFANTSSPGHVEEVPDYYHNMAVCQQYGGDTLVGASGDLNANTKTYSRELAFDGKRANMNSKWMGSFNGLAWRDTGGGPGAGGPGGGGGPGAGGPGGGPGAGGGYAPEDYQYVFCAFPKLTRISRILFDSRFNVSEIPGALPGDFDYLPHETNVWERNFDFFWNSKVLGPGEVYSPWNQPPQPLAFFKDQGYGSTGIVTVFDNAKEPLTAGIIGVHNVDTYADFDTSFHWPYVSEIEAYGFNRAADYVEEYDATNGSTVTPEFNNVVMYFPNYLGSGFDMGRRTYITAGTLEAAEASRPELVHVELEFYPTALTNRDPDWQRLGWWQRDTKELARFQSSFYRDTPTRVDRLPNLHDFPTHQVYGNNEDLRFPFTVPGATSIRGHFSVFNIEPNPATDEVTIEDDAGNVYGVPGVGIVGFGNDFLDKWTDWIPGDTIVIHFKSNGSGNSYDPGYGGFKIDSVEVGSVSTG